jgi:hypothetical protein
MACHKVGNTSVLYIDKTEGEGGGGQSEGGQRRFRLWRSMDWSRVYVKRRWSGRAWTVGGADYRRDMGGIEIALPEGLRRIMDVHWHRER